MRISRIFGISFLVLVIMGLAQTAEATPTLRLSLWVDGTQIGPDILDGDDGAVDGMILLFGQQVGGWDIICIFGNGTLLNGPGMLALDVAVMDNMVGKFVAYLSEDEFPTGPGTLALHAGTQTSTDGSPVYLAQFGSSIFSPEYPPLTLVDSSAPHGSLTSGVMMIGLGFEHTASGFAVSSGSIYATNSNSVPEPVSLTLLGVGIAGISLFQRRKSR